MLETFRRVIKSNDDRPCELISGNLGWEEMAKMKRAIVIYGSKYGNTEKTAKALAKGMGEQGVKADCPKVEAFEINKLAEYDLPAVGGPTHKPGVPQPAKEFLHRVENVDLGGKKPFVFNTKVKLWVAGSAAKGIENTMKKLGLNIVKPERNRFYSPNQIQKHSV